MPGVVVVGSSTFEWLYEKQFVISRSHYEHPDIPDAISIIGHTDGLRMHYFDSRGVYRLYHVTFADNVWVMEMGRHSGSASFASSDAPFSQRITYTFEADDQRITGKGQLSHDDINWNDDLEITYRRSS